MCLILLQIYNLSFNIQNESNQFKVILSFSSFWGYLIHNFLARENLVFIFFVCISIRNILQIILFLSMEALYLQSSSENQQDVVMIKSSGIVKRNYARKLCRRTKKVVKIVCIILINFIWLSTLQQLLYKSDSAANSESKRYDIKNFIFFCLVLYWWDTHNNIPSKLYREEYLWEIIQHYIKVVFRINRQEPTETKKTCYIAKKLYLLLKQISSSTI